MIVAFTSLNSSGATFMDWSWNYLKGNKKYWRSKIGWGPLSDNPIQNTTAHGHKKNHPKGFDKWEEFLELAIKESHDTGKDISFYPIFQPTADNLNEYVNHINLMIKRKVSVVVIKKTQEFPYGSERAKMSDNRNAFMVTNTDLSPNIDLKKLREMVSIRMVPRQKTWLGKIDLAFNLLDKEVVVVTDKEWTSHPEQTIIEICERLGTTIDPERLINWRPIMHQWCENYKKTEVFYNHEIPRIAEKIIKNEYMDLRPFNFRFEEECLVMMFIMRTYGKKLLLPDDNFPKNTKDLHRFLK
jgi:hypothetical protein